ncbi:MAG: cytochrome B5 [Deltaproteobacteria bacterium CG2_30_66_27]|nr:MAG: cytochrome B5 [Deltaproteobacteria bacterium CG2_30_66_27]PJB32029.1 MAG: cytochrome B5 [Deltaproteobacteria bacterium CG_4_9_14_3_um_filter_65_9]
MRRFTRKELVLCNGEASASVYIGYKGYVYDVSRSFLWQGGKHFWIHNAGADLTRSMGQAPHGEDMLERCPIIGELADE